MRMMGLSGLEMAVARLLAAQVSVDGGGRWLAQLTSAEVIRRQFTGVGFFATISVDRKLPPAPVASSPAGWVRSLVGPAAYPLEFMIFIRDGYADMIEAYSFYDGYGDLDLLTCEFTAPEEITAEQSPLS